MFAVANAESDASEASGPRTEADGPDDTRDDLTPEELAMAFGTTAADREPVPTAGDPIGPGGTPPLPLEPLGPVSTLPVETDPRHLLPGD